MKTYAVRWMGSLLNRFEIAERVSPLTYVRTGLPPILTIHGDADPTVPYAHAVRLNEQLDAIGVAIHNTVAISFQLENIGMLITSSASWGQTSDNIAFPMVGGRLLAPSSPLAWVWSTVGAHMSETRARVPCH